MVEESPRQRGRSTSTEPEATIDLLKDPRFRKSDEWFGDASFACKQYPFGSLSSRPSHVPDPKKIEKSVIRAVQEAEDCESSDDEEEATDAVTHEETNESSKKKSSSTKEMSVVSMVRRLATKPTMLAVRFLGWALSKVWRAAFTSVHLHNTDIAIEAVRRSTSRPGTALIILPTHRSHADYLLMSYIFFGLNLPVPLIAAGDNLNVPLLGSLLSRAGAFFIRRSTFTPRYRLVLQAYLYELARSGAPIEFFIEGGRSRRGFVGKPKIGLLGMIIQMVRDGDLSDALLLPVSLDYDRVPEGNGFANEVLGTGTKKPESLFGTLKAAVEWFLWGKVQGGVYVGFPDRIISVHELLTKYSKSSTVSLLSMQRTNSPFDPTLMNLASKYRKKPKNGQNVTATDEEQKPLKPSGDSFAHQLHHHHTVPPPGAMFRGGSGVSLANSMVDDDGVVADIGRIVVDAQRDAALITVGGVASCAMLMTPPNENDTLDDIKRRSSSIVHLLVEIGHGHRIPDGILTSLSLNSDIEQIVETLGGVSMGRSGAKSRICLRYAAAPILVRLLPCFVIALNEKLYSDFHSWLAGMFDIELSQENEEYDEEEDLKLTSTLRKDLCELIAPVIIILGAALDSISQWKHDTIFSEEEAVSQVRGMFPADVPFPELSAPLEIAAAFRASVIHKVLKKTSIVGGKTNKKVTAYELEAVIAVPLARGKTTLDSVRKKLDKILAGK